MKAQDRRPTVLIVDDDEDILESMVGVLEASGYLVLAAKDGSTALRLLRSGADIDLLFTDLMLSGGMAGFSLVREAKRLRPALRVLYASGCAALHEIAGDEMMMDEPCEADKLTGARDKPVNGRRLG